MATEADGGVVKCINRRELVQNEVIHYNIDDSSFDHQAHSN